MSSPMHNIQVACRQRSIEPVGSDVASARMRIFVLDVDSEIIGQLENALWVWPHKSVLAANVEDTVCLCMQVEVFAAPNHASFLQIVFVNHTELAMSTGSER